MRRAVAIASLFKSGSKELLGRVKRRDWSSSEEKVELFEQIAAATDLKITELLPHLFSPDGSLRKAVGTAIAARKDPKFVRSFLNACSSKPEAARRAALNVVAAIPSLKMAVELGQLLEDKEAEVRANAADCLLELPLNAETVPMVTKVIEKGAAQQRLKAVTRFAAVADARYVPFFQKLIEDPDERIRQAAYQTIIKFATPEHLPLFLSKVAAEPYSTQQILIQGIQQLVPQAGPEALEQVLDLLASGDTGLRTASIKILMTMNDRVSVVKRFIAYSKGLLGWVRDRALASLREFGPDVLEPALELIHDPDAGIRAAALGLISGFDDPRVAQAAVTLLDDDDWWVSINAADLLGRLQHPDTVPALAKALARDELRWSCAEALGRIGGQAAIQALATLNRDERTEIRIEALQAIALSDDDAALSLLQNAAETDPAKWVRTRSFELLKETAARRSATLDEAAVKSAVDKAQLDATALEIHRYLASAREHGASDLHISVDSVPIMRVGGLLKRFSGDPLTAERALELLHPLLEDDMRERLEKHKQLDACFFVHNDGRYRGNLFFDRKGLNAAFRVIPNTPPTIVDLGLPADMAEVKSIHQGIIVVTGPAGSGKSTTLAALVNLINETKRDHILTLEDPVEFVHPFKNSLINQRDIHKHSESFAKGLRAALREDPDVIVIGELRDTETVTLALNAAETGHVVLTTMNATTAHKAIDRIIGSFPHDEQAQVRESFAGSVKIVIGQSLVPSLDGKSLVGCFEILKGTHSVAQMIRDNKTFQLPSLMQISSHCGMKTFDDSLMDLVRTERISAETAYMRATSKDTFEPLVTPKFLEEYLA